MSEIHTHEVDLSANLQSFYLENSTQLNESMQADEIQKIRDEVKHIMGNSHSRETTTQLSNTIDNAREKNFFSQNLSMSTFCQKNYFDESFGAQSRNPKI